MTPANRHDGPVGWALVRGIASWEGEKPSLFLRDSAYDAEGLFQAAEEKGLLLLSGHNRRRGKPRGRRRGENLRRLQRGAYRRLYRRRWEVETVFGLLKGSLGLAACLRRVRGLGQPRITGRWARILWGYLSQPRRGYLEAVSRQVTAVVTAFSFVAQVLAREGLPPTWVARVAA